MDGQITQYVYDGDEVIGECDGAGTLLRTFVYGPGIDEPICMYAYNLAIGDMTGDDLVNLDDLRALAGKWLLTDQAPAYDPLYDLNQDGKITNGDTDLLSAYWRKTPEPVQVFYYHFDGLGSVMALSDAAGNVIETYTYDVYGRSQPHGPATGNPYRFTGRRWDTETGLYYYRARYYNPTIGRFLQTDPTGYKDGINWYLYCRNNPIVLVDPLGLGSKMATAGRTRPWYSSGYYSEISHIALQGSDPIPKLINDIKKSPVGRFFNDPTPIGQFSYYSAISGIALHGNPNAGLTMGDFATQVALMDISILGAGISAVGAAPSRAAAAPTGRIHSVGFQTQLRATSYPGASRALHVQEANANLLRAMEADVEFAQTVQNAGINLQRTATGLAPRTPPAGWTWHHAGQPGMMELVPRVEHTPGSIFWDALHPGGQGGYAIWGQ